jgi:CheY-like chemotaxis protein
VEGLPILYVEDCARDAELFRRALLQMRPQSRLLQFKDAISAQRFLSTSFAQHQQIELIVADINLPGMDGRELIRWIRSQPNTAKIPVIALSGQPVFKTVEESQELGATSFLLKPADYDGWVDLAYHLQDYCVSP